MKIFRLEWKKFTFSVFILFLMEFFHLKWIFFDWNGESLFEVYHYK
jgi:hypothetical protein